VSAPPIQTIAAAAADPITGTAVRPLAPTPSGPGFATWLLNGIEKANQDVARADAMAKAFATDDSIPVHQVTYALEQARLSLELMVQVRTRLVDAYQELSRMQL
jgi:flagellar hook-basal body complex protein FliE